MRHLEGLTSINWSILVVFLIGLIILIGAIVLLVRHYLIIRETEQKVMNDKLALNNYNNKKMS